MYPESTLTLQPASLDLTRRKSRAETKRIDRCSFAGGYQNVRPVRHSRRPWRGNGLRLPANPNGRPNADVLKPWFNGMDLTRRPAPASGLSTSAILDDRDGGGASTRHRSRIRCGTRQDRNEQGDRARKRAGSSGGRHWRPRALANATGVEWSITLYRNTALSPNIARSCGATPEFIPINALIVIARDDDTTFGILHSRFHEAWSLRLGTSSGRPPALHADHHLRDLPVPGRSLSRRSSRRLCGRPARPSHCRGRAAACRAARPLAQPARMGGVGGRAGSGLSQTPGRPRRGGGQGAQETHPHQPLQRPPPMARRRPRRPRHRRGRRLWLAR